MKRRDFIVVPGAAIITMQASIALAQFNIGGAIGAATDAAKAATRWTFIVSGIASLALAAFSLVLPKSQAQSRAQAQASGTAWAEAFGLLKHPFILVLWLVTLVDSFVHNAYFNWTGVFLGTPREAGGVGIASNWITPVMSIGQVAEILTMLILGATLARPRCVQGADWSHHQRRARANVDGARSRRPAGRTPWP